MLLNFQSLLISGMAALAAGGLAWYVGRAIVQITYVTLADGRRQERRLPLSFRLMLPFVSNLKKVFRKPLFKKLRFKLHASLVSGGYDGLLSAEELLAFCLLSPLALGTLLSLWLHLAVLSLPAGLEVILLKREGLLCLLIYVLMATYPVLWLRGVVSERRKSIQRALPFVLDLLTLSVESGLDFMSGINRIVNRRKMDPLGEELLRVFREIQIGKTRRIALRDMAVRVGSPDIWSLVNALVQADELGTSIGVVLRIQSQQMRTRRHQRAEKKAHEAPVKMLLPLVAFIFPTVFIILLAPIISKIFAQGIF